MKPVQRQHTIRRNASATTRPMAVRNTASDPQDAGQLLLKPADAAKALAISERTLWALTRRGEIPCVRFGGAKRYDPKDLQAWIDARKT